MSRSPEARIIKKVRKLSKIAQALRQGNKFDFSQVAVPARNGVADVTRQDRMVAVCRKVKQTRYMVGLRSLSSATHCSGVMAMSGGLLWLP